jgi:oligoribonuclease
LVRIWYKKDESFKKELNHRAIDDIKESIAELKFYRENYFINK